MIGTEAPLNRCSPTQRPSQRMTRASPMKRICETASKFALPGSDESTSLRLDGACATRPPGLRSWRGPWWSKGTRGPWPPPYKRDFAGLSVHATPPSTPCRTVTGPWASGPPIDLPEGPTRRHSPHHPTPLPTNDDAMMWPSAQPPCATSTSASAATPGHPRTCWPLQSRPASWDTASPRRIHTRVPGRGHSCACRACGFTEQETVRRPKTHIDSSDTDDTSSIDPFPVLSLARVRPDARTTTRCRLLPHMDGVLWRLRTSRSSLRPLVYPNRSPAAAFCVGNLPPGIRQSSYTEVLRSKPLREAPIFHGPSFVPKHIPPQEL